MATIQYTGWLFKDDGTAVDGASVQLYEQGSTTTVGSAVTTGDSSWADGYWEITTTQEPDSTGEYYAHDVKITSGSSVRWLRGKTRESFAEVDIRNATGATQGGLLVANNANTASNKVATFANRRKTGVDGDEIYISFEMMNDADEIHEFARITAEAVDSADGNEDGQLRFGISDGDAGTPGAIVDVLTLNTTVGGVTSVITDTISQYNNTITVGVDNTGYDVKFFGASAGAYMLYDESADQLIVMGASADATTSTGKLLLATSLTDVNANDVLGKIEFQAPHETGTDAITVAAAIEAVAQGTFAAAVNATDIIFKTGHSEAATEKFRFTSQGEIGIGGATYGSSGDVLTSGGAGAAPTWATPTTGDITAVSLTGDSGGALSVASGAAGFTLTGGAGIDTAGSSTTVTFTLDLNELTDTAIANGDYIIFTDATDSNATVKGDLEDVATLFAGDGLQASSSVMSLDLVSNGGLEISSNELQVATGISQHDIAQYAASVADNDFLRIDGTKVEGLSAAEVAAAIESSIDAVGTIATGEWNGTVIAEAYLPNAGIAAEGVVELATAAEINTSTDAGRVMTPDLFSASNYGIRYVGIVVADSGTALTTGDGKAYFHIPAGLDGMDLMEAHAEVNTAPVGAALVIEVSKNGNSTQMLTTNITIAVTQTGSDQTTAPAFATDGSEAVATNDLIQININQIGSSTAGSGLIVTLGFRIP